MPRSKKIFAFIAVLFTLTMLGFAIHMGSKTTRRGAKKQLQQRISDKLKTDTLTRH